MAVKTLDKLVPVIGVGAYIHEAALVVGDVSIGEDSSLWPGVVVRGDVHSIRIGRRTNIQDGTVLHVTGPEDGESAGYPVVIGDEVTVGHRAVVHGCTVGNRVLIGIGAIVLDGAVIEDEVVVAAGSVVAPRKVLESGYLYIGAPARRIRPLNATERRGFDYSAEHYVQLKDTYLSGYRDQ